MAIKLFSEPTTDAQADAQMAEACEREAATAPGLCESCQTRSAGHGHFALYCLECSELPYGVKAV